MTIKTKPKNPPIGFLAVQPYFLTVGQKGGFKNAKDFYNFAFYKCGFECVTVPISQPFIDEERALKSAAYRDEVQAMYHGKLVRFETHVDGQLVNLHPADVCRFRPFAPKTFKKADNRRLERYGAKQMRRHILLSAVFGFHDIPSFCGNRAFTGALYPWSGYPEHLKEWVLANLVAKWEDILEFAADHDQWINFEIFHPMEDLLTADNFLEFYEMLSTKAKRGVGVNVDFSHLRMISEDPIPHLQALTTRGIHLSFHFKWAQQRGHQSGYSAYGGFEPWSTRAGQFATFGLFETRLCTDLMCAAHAVHDKYPCGTHIIFEGECLYLPNPKQAMRVGAHNCRAIRDGEKPLTWEDLEDKVQPWEGPPFDKFAMNPTITPAQLLQLQPGEVRKVKSVLARK